MSCKMANLNELNTNIKNMVNVTKPNAKEWKTSEINNSYTELNAIVPTH